MPRLIFRAALAASFVCRRRAHTLALVGRLKFTKYPRPVDANLPPICKFRTNTYVLALPFYLHFAWRVSRLFNRTGQPILSRDAANEDQLMELAFEACAGALIAEPKGRQFFSREN